MIIPSLRYAYYYLIQHVFCLDRIEGKVEYGQVKNMFTMYTRTVIVFPLTSKHDKFS